MTLLGHLQFPVEWLKAVMQKYPELHFQLKYAEEGIGFSGIMEGQGEEWSDSEGEYGEYYGLIYCELCFCEGHFEFDEMRVDYQYGWADY